MTTPVGGTRNTPTLFNRTHTTKQCLDGRAHSLEDQALAPILNPLEMNNTVPILLQTLTSGGLLDGCSGPRDRSRDVLRASTDGRGPE